jgi:biotin carboxyl carrier protein
MADLRVTPNASPSGDEGPDEAAGSGGAVPPALVDPRAVRVGMGPASALSDDARLVVGPPMRSLAPHGGMLAGRGLLGGQAPLPHEADPVVVPPSETPILDRRPAEAPTVIVDGEPVAARLVWDDHAGRATLVEGEGALARRARVVFTSPPRTGSDGIVRREVVVDGWRFDVELESERRAALRERARRGHETSAHGGPTEVRAIIPGRVVSVSVAPGDDLTAGQQILVVEAMKMQNELRAPRDGTVQRVGVAPGETIEVGDLLLVIE